LIVTPQQRRKSCIAQVKAVLPQADNYEERSIGQEGRGADLHPSLRFHSARGLNLSDRACPVYARCTGGAYAVHRVFPVKLGINHAEPQTRDVPQRTLRDLRRTGRIGRGPGSLQGRSLDDLGRCLCGGRRWGVSPPLRAPRDIERNKEAFAGWSTAKPVGCAERGSNQGFHTHPGFATASPRCFAPCRPACGSRSSPSCLLLAAR